MELTNQMIMVMAMIGIAVFLFVIEWVRVDVVAIIMMVTLPLLGLVTPTEAFIGLSSNAVVSIIAVIIIGAGLDKTGSINRLVAPVMKIAGNSQSRITIMIAGTVAAISSFMQNIGAAALFLPAIQRVSKNTKIPLSQLLMPIGFSAILGGTITLVGCSPLILLNDLMIPFKLKPFGLFDVTPIGLALVGSGILYFIVFRNLVLPRRSKEEEIDTTSTDHLSRYHHLGVPWEVTTPNGLRERPSLRDLRDRFFVNVIGSTKSGSKNMTFSPSLDQEMAPDTHYLVIAKKENLERLANDLELEMKEDLDLFKKEMSPEISGTIEAVVSPRSELVGKTLLQAHFRDKYSLNALAIYRSDRIFYAGLSSIPLQIGDAILLQGSWRRFQILRESKDLILATPLDAEIMKPEKALWAGFWLAVALIMIMAFKIQLSVALMTGALGMIVTRVLSIDEAYKAVDWRTIFLLGGLIPLGIATEKTGTAAYIAQTVLTMLGQVSPLVLLTVIGILSTIFTLVISNVGATVLLVPLVVNMAMGAGTDPRMAALVVGLATSNSFMLPTHQVNALYMGPGRYRSVDFIKAGSIMSFIFIVVMIGMIYLWYGAK
jgi:di/tricarboxylate transporter